MTDNSQELTIYHLRETIADLSDKVHHFKRFIEINGLAEAFKEFLNPKKVVEKIKEDRAKRIEERTIKQKEMPVKKKKGPVR